MTNLLGSIRLAGYAFSLIAALVAVPLFCRQMRARCFNWVRTAFGGLFLFYVLCVLALVFFPLPDAAQAAKLSTYRIQLVPFQFVADFLRETPLVFSDARTYLPALLDRTVLQVVCNILMLMPFGMYLRYVCGLDVGRVALASLAFSAFIELGQLTGLFFVFRGSYRLCDVDDLMLNTLGGLLGGELVRADYVVCDADFPYAITQLVDEADARGKYTPHKVEDMEYSCSCFILYLGLDKRYPSDAVHSIRFASDFERNIDDIFDDARFPDDPSFYCYAPSSLDRSLAPEGCSTLYVLVPVPPLSPASPRWTDAEVAEYRDRVLDLMERETVYEDVRDHIVFERAYTPLDFAERFNAYDGATFGLRPTLGQSNYWRPHNKATDCNRLYFCGSSVHPGAGVPIVLLSAKLAAEELMRDDRL